MPIRAVSELTNELAWLPAWTLARSFGSREERDRKKDGRSIQLQKLCCWCSRAASAPGTASAAALMRKELPTSELKTAQSSVIFFFFVFRGSRAGVQVVGTTEK